MKTSSRNKDIILVMDVSGSMSGDKLTKAKEDAKDLVTTLLTDSNNRIALITFESSSSKLSDLTNNATTLNDLIDNLSVSGSTNYNSGLVETKQIIENYTQVSNKDLVVLFLTDGFPNLEVPNQVSTYQIIKEQYPYVVINAIQYEMGKDIIDDIKNISDNQFIASMVTLNNVLFEASIEPEYYEYFKVEDYISENFEIESIGNISSTKGTVNLSIENGLQKVTWNLGSNYRTSTKETLTIDVLLKTSKQNLDELFETNDHERIISKLESDIEREVNSELTPILAGKYTVIYDTNTPSECSLSNIPSERHFPYETVNIRTQELSCSNYIFKGYEVEDLDVKKINTSSFIMPGHDVTIRALWGKLDISQKMDGEVATALDFYKIIKNEYKSNSGYAKLYTGSHQDSFTREATKDIYYFTTPTSNNVDQGNTLLDKINVLFGGFCWQMLRTTDTGGVKMIYNGIPVDGKCLNTRSNVNGLKQGNRTTNNMNGSYVYGSDFTYDLNAGTFKIAGNIKENINYSSDKSVIGYYTCKNADKDSTCTELYYLDEEYSNSNTYLYVYIFTFSNSTNYAQTGTTIFNGKYNSPAYLGYMYNKVYEYQTAYVKSTKFFTNGNNFLSKGTITTSWYYADSVDMGNINTNQYTLINPTQWQSGATNLVGKYAMNNRQNFTDVYYIEAVNSDGKTIYYRTLTNDSISTRYYYGDSFEYNTQEYIITNATKWSNGVDVTGKYVAILYDGTSGDVNYVIGMVGNRIFYERILGSNMLEYNQSLMIGDSITDNGNGTYTLNNASAVTYSDWIVNYANYEQKYTCGNANTTCAIPRYIVITEVNIYQYINHSNEILIAKTRNGMQLGNTLLVRMDELSKNRTNYSDYIYTCADTNSTCTEDSLKKITGFNSNGYDYILNRYIGSSATWDGTKYILNNILEVEDVYNLANLSTHHYTCIDPIGTECSSVGYIYYYSNDGLLYYILLENGIETVEEALNEMLYANNVNAEDSPIKRYIEAWFYNNLIDYDSYLEETIYCNNRIIENMAGWKDDGGVVNRSLEFKESNKTKDLSCPNETDKFSVLNNKAKIKYKIGLSSTPEMNLLNNNFVRYVGSEYWLISPNGMLDDSRYAFEAIVQAGSSNNTNYINIGQHYVNYSHGVRPVISLASGVVPASGSGTMADPYVVDESVIPGT